jgi:hypothetical protein
MSHTKLWRRVKFLQAVATTSKESSKSTISSPMRTKNERWMRKRKSEEVMVMTRM